MLLVFKCFLSSFVRLNFILYSGLYFSWQQELVLHLVTTFVTVNPRVFPPFSFGFDHVLELVYIFHLVTVLKTQLKSYFTNCRRENSNGEGCNLMLSLKLFKYLTSTQITLTLNQWTKRPSNAYFWTMYANLICINVLCFTFRVDFVVIFVIKMSQYIETC